MEKAAFIAVIGRIKAFLLKPQVFLVLVFIAGVLTGGILMLITLMHPTWLVPEFSAPTLSTSLTTVFPKVCLLLAICFISLGTTGLVGSVVLNRRR